MAEKTKKDKKGRITIDKELCKGCYFCISVCPKQLITVSEELNQKGYYPAEFKATEDKDENRKCTGCTVCAIICPDIAIEVYRG
jgi:2-oxoglutarate ferredoxin oxidoreductase subunit delta